MSLIAPPGPIEAGSPPRRPRPVIATVSAIYLAGVGWTVWNVVATRLSKASNDWLVPDLTVLGLISAIAISAAILARMGRRVLLAAVMAALSTAGFGAAIWVTAAALPKRADIAVPAPSAPPLTVLRAYIAALNAHDTKTAKELVTPGFTPRTDTYFSVSIVEIVTVLSVSSLPPGPGVDIKTRLHEQFRSAGPSEPNGVNSWNFYLARKGPAGAWRVVGEGLG
jgi:hypothetical protein